jgi:type IX secretion system PorP/SprF family membrane protein
MKINNVRIAIMNNLHFVFIILFALTAVKLQAQTEPMYGQYMYNMLGINPAYAGNRDAVGINYFQRKQWIGLQGAPNTSSISIDGPANNNKFGWGVQLYGDELGVEKANGINFMSSTRVQLSNKGILSAGLTFGLMNYRIDLFSLAAQLYQKDDPDYFANKSAWMPTVGLGLYYNTDKFYVGLSMPSVLKSRMANINLLNSGLQKINKQHVFITSGYVFEISDVVKLKPSTMVKMVSGAPIEFDFNTNVWLHELIGFGLSYRTGDAVIGMAELQATDNFRIGYAYESTISPLRFYNNGTHELMLRYEFGNYKSKIKSTRYF